MTKVVALMSMSLDGYVADATDGVAKSSTAHRDRDPRIASVKVERSARNDPNPAPICAIGPSRPPDPPDPIVIGGGDRLHHRDAAPDAARVWWKAAITTSVPWPSASGAKR